MGFNIVETVMAQITPNTVNRIAESSGEDPTKTRSAMTSGTLAILAGMVRHGSSRAGASSMLSALQSPAGAGSGLASGLLGGGHEQITETVMRSGGVNRSTATSIMSTVLPFAGGALSREVLSRRLDADGLASLLQSQRQHILSHPNAPSGLGLGERGAEPTVEREKDVGVYEGHRIGPAAAQGKKSWLPLLAAVLLGLLLLGALLLLVGRKPTAPRVSMPERERVEAPIARGPETPAFPPAETPQPAAPQDQQDQQDQGDQEEMNEPTGQTTTTGAEMTKPAGDDLDSHFTGTGSLPDKVTLKNVNFVFATTQLTDGGDAEIDKLADEMKQHPDSRIRLEGHTDSAGNDDVNAPLSFQRATVVRQKLIDRGIDGNRIEAVGKKDQEPVAPNDTKEGRTQNRRIDVVILKR